MSDRSVGLVKRSTGHAASRKRERLDKFFNENPIKWEQTTRVEQKWVDVLGYDVCWGRKADHKAPDTAHAGGWKGGEDWGWMWAA